MYIDSTPSSMLVFRVNSSVRNVKTKQKQNIPLWKGNVFLNLEHNV